MFRLNLLPPQQKNELKWSKCCHLALSYFLWITVVFGVFILLFINIYFFLHILLGGQQELIETRQNEEKIKMLTNMETEITEENRQLDYVYEKQRGLILWVPIFQELSKITPSGIYLNNFSYQGTIGRVYVSGNANTRENLLNFEKYLKESPYFEEIESPLSNLIRQRNVEFSFSFKPARID